jgi:hypothetical protein
VNTIDTKVNITVDNKRIIAQKIYKIIKDSENSTDLVNYRGYNISLKEKKAIDDLLNDEYIWFFGADLINSTVEIKKEILNSLDGNSIANNLSELEEKSLIEMLNAIKKVQVETDINKITYYNGILVLKEDLDSFKLAYSNTLIGRTYNNDKTLENGQKIVANVEKNHGNNLEIYSYNMQIINELRDKDLINNHSLQESDDFNKDFNDIQNGLEKLHKEIVDTRQQTDNSEVKLESIGNEINNNFNESNKEVLKKQKSLFRKKIMDLSVKMGMAYVNNDLTSYYFYKKELDKLKQDNENNDISLNNIVNEIKEDNDQEFNDYLVYLDSQINNADNEVTKCYYEVVKEKDLKNHTISDYTYTHRNNEAENRLSR